MGMQQILVIVLSVIIVGVGVTIGITSFQAQAYSTNRQAVVSEMQHYIKEGVAYFKTPSDMGGAGSIPENIVISDLATAMGFGVYRSGPYNGSFGTTSDNGDYVLIGLDNDELVLKGLGKESKGGKRPMVQMNLNLNTFVCKTVYGDGRSLQ
ncbi:MAG TPA: hypothetical protein PLE74_04210 [Candidatus Cloacimonadota bacterium]|nr:hypothetical protein [Candidatus Cloacimonadota bacterium]HPT71463.1 hypothetical protein [Candidatus Cloacimonadota bacterium]